MYGSSGSHATQKAAKTQCMSPLVTAARWRFPFPSSAGLGADVNRLVSCASASGGGGISALKDVDPMLSVAWCLSHPLGSLRIALGCQSARRQGKGRPPGRDLQLVQGVVDVVFAIEDVLGVPRCADMVGANAKGPCV
jgi:hypothetical protein